MVSPRAGSPPGRRAAAVVRGAIFPVALSLFAAASADGQEATGPWVTAVEAPQYWAVLVEDVDRSVAWYRDVFALEEIGGSAAEDGSWRIENLRSDRLFVEIIRDDRAESVDRPLGFRKVGFYVPDIDAVAERVGRATGERPRVLDFERFGVRTLQIHDPDGNTIQLFTPIEADD